MATKANRRQQSNGESGLQGLLSNRLVGMFTSLVSAQVVGSGLGFLYWIAATRLLATNVVGVASAAISTQTMLGTLAVLGLGTLLLGELKVVPAIQHRHLLVTALLTSALAGALLAVISIAVAVLVLGNNLHAALNDPTLAVIYVIGVAGTGAGMVLDQVVLGLGRSSLQVWRNLLASGLRFPVLVALVWAGVNTPVSLVVSWVAPWAFSVLWVWWRLRLPRGPRPGSWWHWLGNYWRLALHNHALNLSLQAGPLLIPVVAGVTLAAVPNAEFTVAWLMATFVFIPPFMLATALFAASVKESLDAFRARARRTLPAGLALSSALVVATWLLSSTILRLFGPHYASFSAHLLDLLVLAGLWMVFKDHLVAYARVADKLGFATKLTGVAVLLEIAGAVSGGMLDGARGLTIGWLIALGIQALVGLPMIWRIIYRPKVEREAMTKPFDQSGVEKASRPGGSDD